MKEGLQRPARRESVPGAAAPPRRRSIPHRLQGPSRGSMKKGPRKVTPVGNTGMLCRPRRPRHTFRRSPLISRQTVTTPGCTACLGTAGIRRAGVFHPGPAGQFRRGPTGCGQRRGRQRVETRGTAHQRTCDGERHQRGSDRERSRPERHGSAQGRSRAQHRPDVRTRRERQHARGNRHAVGFHAGTDGWPVGVSGFLRVRVVGLPARRHD